MQTLWKGKEMIDWFFEYVLPVLFVGLIVFLLACIPLAYKNDVKQEQIRKDCFMQEVKTKECEYILWKYENRTKSNTTVMPVSVPVVVRGN